MSIRDIIIGTVKTKDNSKVLASSTASIQPSCRKTSLSFPLAYIPNKTQPLTQSIMQAKTILSTHNTRYISQWTYHKHLILKYRPKELVKTRFHGLRNILEKILRYIPLPPPSLFVSLALFPCIITRTSQCNPHNPGILCWTMAR